MRPVSLAFVTLGLALTPVACTDLSEPADAPEADAQTSTTPPSDDDDALPPAIAEQPKIGDELADGRVTQVMSAASCTRVTVEDPPQWQCSESQIADARKGGSARPLGGASVPVPVSVQALQAEQLQVTDCKGLAALRRPELKRNLQATLAAQREQQLRACLPTQRWLFYDAQGELVPYCNSSPFPGGFADGGLALPSSAASSGGTVGGTTAGGGASEYSTTNTQVQGVDEADFVKNDAQYVYVLSARGLHVIDAWPVADTHELQRLALPGLGTRLFLYDDRLVVYTRTDATGGVPSGAQACTYAYDCKFGAEPGSTTAIVYDVTNPSSPKELTRYRLSGGYVASRRVGSMVYTVVYDRPGVVPPPLPTTLDVGSPEALDKSYEALRSSGDEAVDKLPDEAFLPWIQEQRENGAVAAKIHACDEALVAKAASGGSFTSVVSFDLSRLGAPHRSMIASSAGFIYASGEALYMATDGTDGSENAYYRYNNPNEASAIHKFALDAQGTRYVGTATVRGHLLNQFAMDEREDVLRVATTSGRVPDPNVSSNLSTFSEATGQFAKLGELTGLAPTEDIRSVRFDGTRGFVVTFKKTDPLYVIDLSQPAQPRVLGELKIPGFSTYMHPLDQNHLLGLGFEADDQGSFAYFNGIQIQIFDISVLSEPKLLHKTVIGTRGSASDALTNHLAFNYFAPKSLLALPMTICDGGGNGRGGDVLSFSGLMLFDVSLTAGITERGRMPFVDAAQASGIPSCSGWWTSTSSVVKRSIIMDDYAIGISDTSYRAAAISDLARPLANLSL